MLLSNDSPRQSGEGGGSVLRPGRALLAAAVGVLLLIWPAMLNGGAFFFPDTGTYLRSADAIVGELTGRRSIWSDRRQLYDGGEAPAAPAAADTPAPAAIRTSAPAGPLHPVLLGRSIYYGMAVFPFIEMFGSIGVAAFQAALAVLTIWLTLVAFGSQRSGMPARLLVATALLAGFTALPFFVSLLMPDVFAGFAIALAASAAVGWQRLVLWERVCLAGLLIFSAMAHSSHALLLLALASVTVLIMLFARAKAGVALGLMVLAAVCGIASEQLFVQAVTHRLGDPPIRPPFLTARLINDGPGFSLLKQGCPGIGLVACRYLDRMPRDSDTFLWSLEPRDGVFSTESIPVQRALAKQDKLFAIETVRHDPAGVIVSSFRNIVLQAELTGFNIFNGPAAAGDTMFGAPEPIASEIRASRFAKGTMPVSFWRSANVVSALAAMIFLIVVLVGRSRESDMRTMRTAVALLLSAVALNAAITGAMSKPHARYNVRVTWTLQLAALAILAARPSRKRQEQM